MRTTTAFFAGIGTVVAAIAAGLGGGLVIGDIMSPHQPKHQSSEVRRLEQRASQPPISAMNGASQPVPYLASSEAAATVTEPARPRAETPSQQQPQQAAAPPVDTRQADTGQVADVGKTPPVNAQPVAAVESAAGKDRATPEDSFAKARDADIRRETRRAADRRKAERRQQWAERKRMKQREHDDDDLRDVEASVREATGQRPLFGAPGFGSRISLFED